MATIAHLRIILNKVCFFFILQDLIKIEDAGVATTLKIDFSNIQRQLTSQSRVASGSNSNSSKMLWLSLFLPRMEKIRSKLKALEWPQYKILIFKHKRAANSAVRGRIWPKFELIRDIVVILVTCKNEEDPLKNKDARVAKTQNIDFSNTQGQLTPQSAVGSGRNSNSSEIL